MVYFWVDNRVLPNIEETGAYYEIKDKNSDFFFCNYSFAIDIGRSCAYGVYKPSIIKFGEAI